MAKRSWPTKRLSVASLFLDESNSRLGRETSGRAPREIIQYLFDHDKALDVARSIATRGYFENEPLLAISEGRHYVVVEGNRRLAALKALKEPGLLTGSMGRQVERLARQTDLEAISRVPVTIAPNRRATDRLISCRHIGTPVLPWQAENRASFILSKLEEDTAMTSYAMSSALPNKIFRRRSKPELLPKWRVRSISLLRSRQKSIIPA